MHNVFYYLGLHGWDVLVHLKPLCGIDGQSTSVLMAGVAFVFISVIAGIANITYQPNEVVSFNTRHNVDDNTIVENTMLEY
jgi:hypothetical protein